MSDKTKHPDQTPETEHGTDGGLREGVSTEDALRAFMRVDPEAVKRAEKEKKARKPKKGGEDG